MPRRSTASANYASLENTNADQTLPKSQWDIAKSAGKAHFWTRGDSLCSEETSLPLMLCEGTQEVVGTAIALPFIIVGGLAISCGGTTLECAGVLAPEQTDTACVDYVSRTHKLGKIPATIPAAVMGLIGSLYTLPCLPCVVQDALDKNQRLSASAPIHQQMPLAIDFLTTEMSRYSITS